MYSKGLVVYATDTVSGLTDGEFYRLLTPSIPRHGNAFYVLEPLEGNSPFLVSLQVLNRAVVPVIGQESGEL
jgi:hypothetical protein